MPRIQPEDKTPLETVQFRLRADLHAKLNAYSQFLDGSSTSYIVSESLTATFDADKEFQAYLVKHPELAAHSAAPLILRKRGRPKAVSQATAA